ncbi:hypothetical protein BSNK01_19600 [Bacillaceae bacterium]
MNGQQGGQTKKAIALRYDSQKDAAPVVTAKGTGDIAERIVALAREHDIPVYEDPALVEVLGKVELNEQIPVELYAVVAEVLAFVYRVNEQAGKERHGKRHGEKGRTGTGGRNARQG